MTETIDKPAETPPAGHVEQVKTSENVKLVLRGPDGEIKQVEEESNLIVTTGVNAIVDRLLASPSLGVPTHMAIGTGGTSPAAGQTTLTTELDRNALTSKTRSGAVLTMVGDWAAGDGTGAITEAGVFDASSSGNMYSRALFSTINKAAGDTLQITWTYTLSAT
jgi:hypothetical protein